MIWKRWNRSKKDHNGNLESLPPTINNSVEKLGKIGNVGSPSPQSTGKQERKVFKKSRLNLWVDLFQIKVRAADNVDGS